MEELLKQIGRPYEMFFDDGNYQGCFYPVYYLYPNLPRYPLNGNDPSKSWEYGLKLIYKNAKRIGIEEIKQGDVLVTKYNDELHVAIMIDKNTLIHVFRNHSLQINRLRFFGERPLMFFRVH